MRRPPEQPALQVIFNDAVRHYHAGSLTESDNLCLQILAQNPSHADALHLLGVITHQRGQDDIALKLLDQAIASNDMVASYHANQAAIFKKTGRLDDAVAAYHRALSINPHVANSYFYLGITLFELGRLHEAVIAYHAAIRIQADFYQAHSNLGVALFDLGQLEESITCYQTAIRIQPNFADAHYNLGNTLRELGLINDALTCYATAARIQPHFAQAHYNESLLCLLNGDFSRGWQKYEWRWRGGTHELAIPAGVRNKPMWRGEDIRGRTILLHAEQGLGDTLQFCRYVPLVAARGARVILAVPSCLLRLLTNIQGIYRLVAIDAPFPAFDCYSPLLSLPGIFGSNIETIPASISYLYAEDEHTERWKERLGTTGFKIGIAWQGNPAFSIERGRSAPLAAFAPFAAIPGIRLINLQKHHGLEQLAMLPQNMSLEMLGQDFDAGQDAFIDTAAVMMNLDLIITVDTAIGHLAGALGRPVWIALQQMPHWIWMQNRNDSPWYPSVRLFRQSQRGDWAGVFAQMVAALPEVMDAKNNS